ncbi:MAG: RecX family transcriptional regulator [Actinomycetota bacterium]|nr:RecX family transcriptional regulator [Actinomycetota bacterium]
MRPTRPGYLLLELDGQPWRTVPENVVVRCGLVPGLELERPVLRSVRHELRRADALAVAARVLARSDVSTTRLAERLARAPLAPAAARDAVTTLADLGVLDDVRLARRRAAALSARGWGNAAILARLAEEGVSEADARTAVADLAPEGERVGGILAREREPRRAAGRLARRGFSPETIEGAVGSLE